MAPLLDERGGRSEQERTTNVQRSCIMTGQRQTQPGRQAGKHAPNRPPILLHPPLLQQRSFESAKHPSLHRTNVAHIFSSTAREYARTRTRKTPHLQRLLSWGREHIHGECSRWPLLSVRRPSGLRSLHTGLMSREQSEAL